VSAFPASQEGIRQTHFIVSGDVAGSWRCYTKFSARDGDGRRAVDRRAREWLISTNVGGGPIDDKPTVALETPGDPDRVSSFLNIRGPTSRAIYAEMERARRNVPHSAPVASGLARNKGRVRLQPLSVRLYVSAHRQGRATTRRVAMPMERHTGRRPGN
jgi:hypothetical protein